MSEQEYFKSALSDFTYEAASGGAIRHLADLGYTVRQICDQLSFPTPYARVQKTVWQHLIDTGVVLTKEPDSVKNRKQGKAEYVVEHDKYGRASFRLIAAKEEEGAQICWKERRFAGYGNDSGAGTRNSGEGNRTTGDGNKLAAYLAQKCGENDGEAYISCGFGLMLRKNPAEYETLAALLNERQKEYLSGLLWEEKICYHRLDKRMQEIAVRLYVAGKLDEVCYFMKTGERVTLR